MIRGQALLVGNFTVEGVSGKNGVVSSTILYSFSSRYVLLTVQVNLSRKPT
jgi:hypothetical protein